MAKIGKGDLSWLYVNRLCILATPPQLFLLKRALACRVLTVLSNLTTSDSMVRKTDRNVSWIKRARKDFDTFPLDARQTAARALTQIADGFTPDIAKPLQGLGSGVWELVLKERGDAYRVVYGLQFGDDIWVVHAFQKKSKTGIATPKHEIDVVRERIKCLKEALA
jgi:phage-related protein